MQQFPLPTPATNLPSYNSFLYTGGLENNITNDGSSNTLYQTKTSDHADAFFRSDFNWEYFSNELEFE